MKNRIIPLFLIVLFTILITLFFIIKNNDLSSENIKDIKEAELKGIDNNSTMFKEELCFMVLKNVIKEKENLDISISWDEFLDRSRDELTYSNILGNYTTDYPLGHWRILEFGNYTSVYNIANIFHENETIKENIIIFYYSDTYGFEGCSFTKISPIKDIRLMNMDFHNRIKEDTVIFKVGQEEFIVDSILARVYPPSSNLQMSIRLIIPKSEPIGKEREVFFERSVESKINYMLKVYSPITFFSFFVLLEIYFLFLFFKKEISLMIFILSLIIVFILSFLFLNLHSKIFLSNFSKTTFPISKTKYVINNAVDFTYFNKIWDEKCDIQKNKSMINLIHIVKINDSYVISCEFGDSYGSINYETRDDLPVFFGVIKSCDETTARFIDESVRKKLDCRFPLVEPIPDDLNDYYAFSLKCSNNPLEKELISQYPMLSECQSKLINESILYSEVIGVLDLKNGIFYS